MRERRQLSPRAAGILAAMFLAAILPYVCQGTAIVAASTMANGRCHGDAEQRIKLATGEHAGNHCLQHDCCSEPTKQESQVRADAPLVATPTLALAAAATPSRPAPPARDQRLRVGPPGTSAPLTL